MNAAQIGSVIFDLPAASYAFAGAADCLIENASSLMPRSTKRHVTEAAIGKPGRARGEYVPMAVVPRPLRKAKRTEDEVGSENLALGRLRMGHDQRQVVGAPLGAW
jgi:hypothetical protein